MGTGPGTLVRRIARHFPQLEVHGLDLSAKMILLSRKHAREEQLEGRVHFDIGDAAQVPYPDHSFDVVVSITTGILLCSPCAISIWC